MRGFDEQQPNWDEFHQGPSMPGSQWNNNPTPDASLPTEEALVLRLGVSETMSVLWNGPGRARFYEEPNVFDNDPPEDRDFFYVTPAGFLVTDYEARSKHETCLRIEGITDELLSSPDSTSYRLTSILVGEGPYLVRLSSSTTLHDKPSEDSDPQRWIYVSRASNDETIFSLKLAGLQSEQPLRGLLNDHEEFSKFLACAKNSTTDGVWESIDIAHSVCLAQGAGFQVAEKHLDFLESFYNKHAALGATLIEEKFFRKLPSGVRLAITRRTYEGDAARHFGTTFTNSPLLRIRIRYGEHAVVLEKDIQGSIETAIEKADGAQESLQYARPESIIRDETGKVVGSEVNPNDAGIIREAERATGTRGLHANLLELIEDKLKLAQNI